MWLLDRYLKAIEADLRIVYGVDLRDLSLFGGDVTPRAALNLIDRLPRASHLRHAESQDEELAEMQADRWTGERTTTTPEIPLTDWTPETELLTFMCELQQQTIAVLIAANSDKPYKRPAALPRPVRALDRAIKARADRSYDELVALLEGRPLPGTDP